MSELAVVGSIFAGIVGVYALGYHMGKGSSTPSSTPSMPEKKLTPREQKYDRLLKEKSEVQRELEHIRLQRYQWGDQKLNDYFKLYTDRLAVLNQMIDTFESRETIGKCNLCLKDEQTILSTDDDTGKYGVCVRCIHDNLMELVAKKHWNKDRHVHWPEGEMSNQ